MRPSTYVVQWAAEEVHRQQAPARYVYGMVDAYLAAWDMRLSDDPDDDVRPLSHEDLHTLNSKILLASQDLAKPAEYRNTPVAFSHAMRSACPSAEVSATMDRWLSVANSLVSTTRNFHTTRGLTHEELSYKLVKWFLDIHPYSDGNGRVASILYNLLLRKLDEPVLLPDFYNDPLHVGSDVL